MFLKALSSAEATELLDNCFNSKNLHFSHPIYLGVSYEFQNRERLFPWPALTDWSI
jgi:hypothetical protein